MLTNNVIFVQAYVKLSIPQKTEAPHQNYAKPDHTLRKPYQKIYLRAEPTLAVKVSAGRCGSACPRRLQGLVLVPILRVPGPLRVM